MVWLLETKIQRKSKIMLHGYRSLDNLHKNKYIYIDISKVVETRFDTSNYELYRSLPKWKKLKSNWINERWIR